MVKLFELLEWEIADNITVQHKEGRVIFAENIAS